MPQPQPSTIPPIPERLRQLRTEQGLSLEELATRSGVSRAMLSKIERGTASPTIGLLCKITGALGVSITRLVAEPVQSRCRLVRRDEMPTLTLANGVNRTSVSTELPDWGVEMVQFILAPQGSTGLIGGSSTTKQEIIHVLDGEIEIVLCKDRHHVTTGESFLLETVSCEYEIRNASQSASARFLAAFDRRMTQDA